MLILGIDTSTKFLTLGLSREKILLGELNIELNRELSEKLIPILKDFLKRNRLEINDVDGFAVGIGPGSFTGLRIGLSTIKGFALVLKTPAVGISSLDILAEGVCFSRAESICPIIDAKRNFLYSAIYKKNKERVKRISKYLLVSIDELLKKTKGPTIFVGDGIALYKKKIKDKLGKNAFFASEDFWYPKAHDLLELSHEQFKKHKTYNAHTILPLYLYPKECQIRP